MLVEVAPVAPLLTRTPLRPETRMPLRPETQMPLRPETQMPLRPETQMPPQPVTQGPQQQPQPVPVIAARIPTALWVKGLYDRLSALLYCTMLDIVLSAFYALLTGSYLELRVILTHLLLGRV